MRTCALTAVGELSLVERDRPQIESDEVLVRIDRVGICGSDLHYYQHGENSGNVVDFPHVLGHESAGTVVDVGSDVDSVSESDRVAVEPGIPCGDCSYCTDGEYHLCKRMEYMSSPPVDGALTEYVAWPAELVYPLPDDVSLREGALVEPLSVAMHACERGGVSEGDTVLVTGGGPIGQLVSEVAMARGAADVVLTDVVDEKLRLADRRGVDHTVDVTSEDPVSVVRERVDEDGVDVVFESSGAESAIELTTEAVKRGGTVVFVGIPLDAGLPADVVELIGGEYDLKGSFRFRDTYEEAIEGIRTGRFDVDGIVSFESPFAETQAAFDRAIEPESVKGVVRVSDDS
ncbi:NAD(P)-dependent alcohol dehydrogenase [Halopelagius longus]|uniref:L-iditol 2-dehydrogenase n=1 Tax=Halopelagius longus TaxID=1236180 RepID=A0A1H1FDI0_9EURY|nr:NAD(P)-dependent alcohol dehydrogenase [Halopelagius longus]RDI70158.1 NAD(P)-dependent alcohol dehydrogenase [Halopelagius longus]SDQ98888.1 L-iditol 2-dehydrogenase [Halopelagius longus]